MKELAEQSDTKALGALLAASPYLPIAFLGQGRMGAVYCVEHDFLGRRFAAKLIHPHLLAEHGFLERLRLEARALGSLCHPNVVEVVDLAYATDGRPYLVLELLEGKSLGSELLARRRLPFPEAVKWTCQALSGLRAAHTLGIVHRDIKPDNLFLHEYPGRGRTLKIVDFGMARIMPEAPPTAPVTLTGARTNTGTLVGSPKYMSPEALRGERLDHRTDLYAMGLVLYEMLVGEGPFDYSEAEPPRQPSMYEGVEVPAQLDAILLRALRRNREDRYQNADEFLAQLQPLVR